MVSTNGTKSSSKKRLWVISEPYYPEETSTGHHMTEIAEGLADEFDVHVICGQPNYSKRGTVAPQREIHNNVSINRLPGTRLDKNVIIYRVINMITFGGPVLFKSIFSFRRGDRVLVVTTPPNIPYACAIASLLRGASYTLLIHDNYPQALIAAGKARTHAPIVRAWHFANRWLYKHAAKIIVLGRDMKELAEEASRGLDVPVTWIPNWAELDVVKPTERRENKLLTELGLSDKFVFLYAGNMGYTNDVESLVYCAESLRDNSQPHFLFLGTGAKRQWLVDEVAKRGLNNVTILDPRPRSEQQEFLNACDVAVVTLVRGMFGVSVPSRIYNALAAGKPLLGITEPGSELSRIIDEENIGAWVPPDSKDLLVNTVRRLMEQPDDLKCAGMRARRVAEQKYSLEGAISKYKTELAP